MIRKFVSEAAYMATFIFVWCAIGVYVIEPYVDTKAYVAMAGSINLIISTSFAIWRSQRNQRICASYGGAVSLIANRWSLISQGPAREKSVSCMSASKNDSTYKVRKVKIKGVDHWQVIRPDGRTIVNGQSWKKKEDAERHKEICNLFCLENSQ